MQNRDSKMQSLIVLIFQGGSVLFTCLGKHPVVELLGFVDDAFCAVPCVGIDFEFSLCATGFLDGGEHAFGSLGRNDVILFTCECVYWDCCELLGQRCYLGVVISWATAPYAAGYRRFTQEVWRNSKAALS